MLPRLLRWPLHFAALLQTMVSITVATAGIDPATIRFRHRSVEDGLSQSTINCVIQDHEGFIWLGTQDGLNRYDGYTFNVYRHNSRDSLSISDSYVNSLFEDSKGRLWIGTYSGGLNLYDRDRDAFTHFVCDTAAPSTISGNNVWGIAEEKGGRIWVAVWAGGVNIFDPERGGWTNLRHKVSDPGSLADDRVFCLLRDHTGGLWVGTWSGLDLYDPDTRTFTHFQHAADKPNSLSENRVVSILEDREGDLWIGTLEGGVNLLDRKRSGFLRYLKPPPGMQGLTSSRIGAMALDESGTLWIGTRDGGINCLDKRAGRLSAIVHDPRDPNSLSSNIISSLYADSRGGVWVGTEGSGFDHYDPHRFRFQHIRHEDGNPESLGNPVVRAVCEDRGGNLWIGAAGANLDRINLATMKYAHYRDLLLRQEMPGPLAVMAVLEDDDGRLWIGTDGAGIYLLNVRTDAVRHIDLDMGNPGSLANYVQVLRQGRDGGIWAGSHGGGLLRIDQKTFAVNRFVRRSGDRDQISGNYVWSLHEDGTGKLWAGTWGSGISVLDPNTGRFWVYRHDPSDARSLGHNTILAFHEDAAGTVWIGTLGGGLDAFDRESGTFAHVTEADGLVNNVVSGILEDAEGNLWLSTNKGISCYSPKSRAFRNYDISDGLQSLEFNQNAYFKGRSGRMYFGGINGLNVFTPGNITADSSVPPLQITAFRIFDRPVPLGRRDGEQRDVVLSYDQNFFSFEFAALAYTAPEKNQYRYRLEGFDRDWVPAGSRRYASYTNLDGGEYVFRVLGSNSDGVWNTEGASIRIRVLPPFWETLWFRGLSALVVFGIGFMFYHSRVSRLHREKAIQAEFSRKMNEYQEKERKRIAGELHDSLGQQLLVVRNRLAHYVTPGEKDRGLAPGLAEIADNIQQAIEEVRAISSDLHPHMLDRLGLTKTIESTARTSAEAASLEIRATIDNIDRIFSPVEEINIFRIIQEGINNVIKHSRASECELTVHRTKDRCEIVIQDDGCGFDPSRVSEARTDGGGFGLSNLAERVRLLHGEMTIDSSPGNGTRIAFEIPVSLPSRQE